MTGAQEHSLMVASEAKRLLSNPLFEDAFEALEKKYWLAWRNSQASKPSEREKVYWLITALDEVKAQLTRHITTGKLINEELQQEHYREQLSEDDNGGTSRPSAVV